MARKYDWEAIERDYRTGRFSLGQLSERYGPSKARICQVAKEKGWERDLSEAVRERTRAKITRATLPPEAQQELDGDDEAVVEYAATENAAVVKGHRKLLEHWRGIMISYSDQLTQQLTAEKRVVLDDEGNPVEVDVDLGYVGKCMSTGTQALDRVIKLERQSFGLDAGDHANDEKSLEELIDEVRQRE